MSARPNVPGLEERLPFIWRELIDPCDAPITVWLECMWDPLWDMILEWYAIDIWQILTTAAREITLGGLSRSHRHGGRGKKGRRGFWRNAPKFLLSFDPNEFLGKFLLGGEEIASQPPGLWKWRFWAVYGIIERLQFWYFVLELVSEFLYRWMSAVAETKYCQARDDAIFFSDAAGNVSVGIFGWVATNTTPATKMRNLSFYNGFGVQQTIAHGLATFSGTAVGRFLAVTGQISCRIRCIAGPNIGKENTATATTIGREQVGFSLFLEVGPGDTIVWETLADVNQYDWPQQFFYLQASPGNA